MCPSIRIGKTSIGGGSGSPYWTPPSELTLSLITGGVRLTWVDKTTGEDGFEIWVSEDGGAYSLIQTTAANATTYDDLVDRSGHEVTYKVRVVKGFSYSAYSNESSITIPSEEAEATALFARMVAAGDTPSDEFKTLMNTLIAGMKAEDLFTNQWDCFWITRGIDAASSRLNIIKNAHNLDKWDDTYGMPSFTTKVGYYNPDAVASFKTNYNPATEGSKFTKDNASFLIKVSGTLTTNKGHGSVKGGVGYCYHASTDNWVSINGTVITGSKKYEVGYNCLSRSASDKFNEFVNDVTTEVTSASTNIPSLIMSLIGYTNQTDGTVAANPVSGEKLELAAFGKAISEAKYDSLRTLLDTYFSGLAEL
jgi:hypothetical protein